MATSMAGFRGAAGVPVGENNTISPKASYKGRVAQQQMGAISPQQVQMLNPRANVSNFADSMLQPYQDVLPKGFKGTGQIQNFTPEQMRLFKQMFSYVSPGSYLSQLASGQPEAIEQIEGPALQQFASLMGGLQSRYGAQGATKSSGFQNLRTEATSQFAQQLAAQRQELQRQAISDLMGISESLLGQSPYERFAIQSDPKKQSKLSKIAGVGLPILGAIAGGLIGGPGGAMLGGSIGSAATSGFRR